MTKPEARQVIQNGECYEVLEALRFMRKNIRPIDVPFLVSAFSHHRNTTIRVEIVDMIGLLRSEQAEKFLISIVNSRSHYLVRYYAIRNLIEIGSSAWKPKRKQAKSEFYASLEAYESYVKGAVNLQDLHSLAKEKSQWGGDHWFWLTVLS